MADGTAGRQAKTVASFLSSDLIPALILKHLPRKHADAACSQLLQIAACSCAKQQATSLMVVDNAYLLTP